MTQKKINTKTYSQTPSETPTQNLHIRKKVNTYPNTQKLLPMTVKQRTPIPGHLRSSLEEKRAACF
jgi:hypothetical protein